MLRHRSLLLGLVMLSCLDVGCRAAKITRGKNPDIPAFVDLPAYTNQSSLAVTGTRTANSEVLLLQEGQESVLAPAADSPTFTGTVQLREGSNGLQLAGLLFRNKTDLSDIYTVVLDTIAPASPVVDTQGYVYMEGANGSQVTIRGTRESNTLIRVTTPRGTFEVPAGDSAAWSIEIPLDLGSNQISVVAIDLAGNSSTPVNLTLYGTNVVGPTIDANSYRSPTNNPNITFTGTKPANSQLYVIKNAGSAEAIGNNAATTWSYPWQLGADGTYRFEVYVEQSGSNPPRSASAYATIVLDTVPPGPATNIVPLINGALPATGESTLALQGTVPDDAYLCVSYTLNGPCIASSLPTMGGTVNILVPLLAIGDPLVGGGQANSGSNTLFVSSRDAAGNRTPAGNGTIYRIAAPTINIIKPRDNAIIEGAELVVRFEVVIFPNDKAVVGHEIANLEVCVDGSSLCTTPVLTADPNNNVYEAMVDVSSLNHGSGHTFSVVVANQIGAVGTQIYSFTYFNGEPTWLSNTGGVSVESFEPSIAYDSLGNTHVVWSDYCSASQPLGSCRLNLSTQAPDIFYARKDVNGTWSNIIVVSSTNPAEDGISDSPAIAVDSSNNVHVVWLDTGDIGNIASRQTEPNRRPMVVHRVLDASNNWAPGTIVPIIDSGDYDNSNRHSGPAVLAGIGNKSNTIYAAWSQNLDSNIKDIYLASYTSNAWGTPIQMNNDPNRGQAELPALANINVNNNDGVQVAWQECRRVGLNNYCSGSVNYDIYTRGYTNAFTSAAILVSHLDKNPGTDGDSRRPAMITTEDQNVIIYWDDTGTLHNNTLRKRMIVSRAFAGGIVPLGMTYDLVSVDSSRGSSSPFVDDSTSVAINAFRGAGDPVAGVVWVQKIGTQTDIYGRGGLLGQLPTLQGASRSIYSSSGNSTAPKIMISQSGNAEVVWVDVSTLGGGTINPPDPLGNTWQAIFFKVIQFENSL